MINGWDYASVDGNRVDYTKAGGSFVIIRGSYCYGKSCLPDSNLVRDRDLWQKAGKRVGAYMILSWNTTGPSPEDQVAVFARAYGARRAGELPPFLDLEADSAASLHRTTAECLEWAHRAYDALVKLYGFVGIYTSKRVWSDVFGDLPSRMGDAALWLKVAYPYKVKQPHHPDAAPLSGIQVPGPWLPSSSPGMWIVQYQGDAIGVPGFSNTVDCNYFVTRTKVDRLWVACKLYVNGDAVTIAEWQKAHGLPDDGVIGPTTFCAMATG